MNERFNVVNGLNERMVKVFTSNNEIYPVISDESISLEKKLDSTNQFEGNMRNMYDILLEYATTVMGLRDAQFTEEWLICNISVDKSHILAEKSDEPVAIEIFERASYLHSEYVPVLLKLQNLILNGSEFEVLLNFYDEELESLIGMAKMLMYHAEDLEDILLIERRKNSSAKPMILKDWRKAIEDMRKKEE